MRKAKRARGHRVMREREREADEERAQVGKELPLQSLPPYPFFPPFPSFVPGSQLLAQYKKFSPPPPFILLMRSYFLPANRCCFCLPAAFGDPSCLQIAEIPSSYLLK